jgi:hypothetical protein
MESSSPLSVIQGFLSLEESVGRPTAAICATIGALRDLCELQSAAAASNFNWRNGGGGGGGGNPRSAFKGSYVASKGGAAAGGGATGGEGTGASRGGGNSNAPTTHSHAKYQSKFKNNTQPVEDKILNNIILSKLNKFSGNTYNDVRDFLYQILGSGEPDLVEMIRHFMLLVFKKAASEETYCPLYAKLLCEISGRYSVILDEMHKLQAGYMDIFEDIQEVTEGQDSYEVFVEKNKDKRYRQGYSQFLAECAALEILDISNLKSTFKCLFELIEKYGKQEGKKALMDDYADCLLRMSKVLVKKSTRFFIGAREGLAEFSVPAINAILENKALYPSISPKARCILMDVKDNLTN